ncbi:hypothetical protein DFA_05331 [Cavenderia fasciculata]|uniref:Uncharacterized protein n=1 Tax=Cavenderia fasciculata TaxID=261658 RepID=F4PKX7_CACFS|nr:uncharacterized protein DFA_05331 [Cavenderia fasciculata]EGG23199.1 hypothetical protein DFA_05331 [Cavenderia fasciculata]|eukprot:XP_004361050.1 hypothetical protein DFA_05331 [Cavenderia fasciculata]
MLGNYVISSCSSFREALSCLCELDFDSVEAFKVLIGKLDIESVETKTLMTSFMMDHERHIQEITEIMAKRDERAPSRPDAKQYLTKGRVYLGGLMGEQSLLSAQLSNEHDLENAYELISKRQDKWPEAEEMIQRGVRDEHRHRIGLQQCIELLQRRQP